MKNTMKKVLCTLLVVVMLSGALSILSISASNTIFVGDTITLGTYNGSPIRWVCVDIDEYGPLMMSEDVLCTKEYDAPGKDSTYHSDSWGYIREKYGSNCWYDSNIRQWLNTRGTVNYTHCPPSYSVESGFMSNFTADELNCVKSVTRLVNVIKYESKRNGYCSGGSKDTVVDEIYNMYFPATDYYYNYIEDNFFLLSAVQFNNIYRNNPEYLSTNSRYFTCITSGNNENCFEWVACVQANKTSLEISANAYMNTGIRPAFYLNEDAYKQKENIPVGYNFYEDSYGFENDDWSISKKYFTTFYEPSVGKVLYKNKGGKTGGVCFGMTYTTSAIFNGFPSANSIYKDNLVNADIYRNSLRESNEKDKLKIGDLEIKLEDYIKYAHLYKYSDNWQNSVLANQNDTVALIDTVKKYTENSYLSVAICFNSNVWGCHEVLAVGIKGNQILVDDPNYSSGYNVLTINQDGSWNYSGIKSNPYRSENSDLYFTTDTHIPYKVLLTGDKLSVNDSFLDPSSMCIEGIERMDSDKNLLCVSENSIVNSENKTEIIISPSSSESSSEANYKLYWLDQSESVAVSDFTDETNEVSLAGDNTILTANVTKNSTVTMTIDESDINAQIETEKGEEYTVSVETITSDEDYNYVETVATVTGTASGSEITATQTDTGLLVTGISDGTVTLTKDDEVIATEKIEDAVGDVEITYDKDGEDEDVELDYHSHSYTSEITTPATHTAEGVMTYTCDCGDSYTEPVEKIAEHTYEKTEIAPSCTANGIVTYTCACNDSYTEIIEATGHSYADNGICKKCDNYDKAYDKNGKTDNCSCNCHKGGFMGFIWKLINFFYKLFGVNKTCSCGVSHY